MGPQPGSDALLAKENLRVRAILGDLRRSNASSPPPPPSTPLFFLRAEGRHENNRLAMKTEFSYVCDIHEAHGRCKPAGINRQRGGGGGGRRCRSTTIKYGGTSRRQTTGGIPERNRLLYAIPCAFCESQETSSRASPTNDYAFI